MTDLPKTGWLRIDNHRIGCELEAIADVLRFRSCNKEAEQLDLIASRLK